MSLEPEDSDHGAGGLAAPPRGVSTAMRDGLEAQRTIHHHGIETYRRTAHTLLAMSPQGGTTPATGGVDAHCDAMHDLVAGGWSLYTTLLADGVELTGTLIETGRRVGGDTRSAADLETIAGIGPAYADQLRALGIESVADLARADPAIGAEIDGIGVDVADWIERAATRTAGD